MSPLCPPGWRSPTMGHTWTSVVARGLWGPQPGPGLGWGGHQVWGAASGLGPPPSQSPSSGQGAAAPQHRPHTADSWSPPCPWHS